jgi:hypothetical protein
VRHGNESGGGEAEPQQAGEVAWVSGVARMLGASRGGGVGLGEGSQTGAGAASCGGETAATIKRRRGEASPLFWAEEEEEGGFQGSFCKKEKG